MGAFSMGAADVVSVGIIITLSPDEVLEDTGGECAPAAQLTAMESRRIVSKTNNIRFKSTPLIYLAFSYSYYEPNCNACRYSH
jgi:hypothetical protein